MKQYPFNVVSIRLVKDAPIMSGKPITKPLDAVELIGKELCEMDKEVLCVINRKANGVPINCNFVSIGTLNEAHAHPREILKSSILSNAASMVIVHNHPSGDLTPSKLDTIVTDRMLKVCDLMGITLDDHIIVGGDNSQYFSFRERDMLEFDHIHFNQDYQVLNFEKLSIAEDRKESEPVIPRRRGR